MATVINLPGTQIEILNPDFPRGKIRHALFDFDGTLSLVREGWQDVMVPMMFEYLSDVAREESPQQIMLTIRDFVTRLTGKQTIYQMIELADQIKRRGARPWSHWNTSTSVFVVLESALPTESRGLNQRISTRALYSFRLGGTARQSSWQRRSPLSCQWDG